MSFNITGDALIGGVAVKGNGGSFEAWDPAARAHIAPAFHMVDVAQIDAACRLAQAAFDPFRATSDAQRADFLDTIAAQIGELGDVDRTGKDHTSAHDRNRLLRCESRIG